MTSEHELYLYGSGILVLISKWMLRDYNKWCSVHNGVQFEYMKQMKTVMFEKNMINCSVKWQWKVD